MQQTTTVCDFCQKQKGATNKWFVAWLTNNGTHDKEQFTRLHIVHANDPVAQDQTVRKDICGEKCLITAVARWTETGSLEAK